MYGNAPKDLGLIDLSPTEMMFWLYCPIKTPGHWAETVPENLKQFEPLVEAVFNDISSDSVLRWRDSYVYLTAKRIFASPGAPGNRLGWHADGFGTNDLNYIWYDANPTIFWVPQKPVSLSKDHTVSMTEMAWWASRPPGFQRRYTNKHLLRLDSSVIHAVEPDVKTGMRTFVKVSVSEKPYALEGNSVNHKLGLNWTYAPRAVERNCPIKGTAA
ncbi:hypothetical protein HU230_0012645 [Bradyrhizobium quebecense]|uniref:Uncharacterized protein n=1 Tax=Bradyrhizobium quebecense TaxID=2748629 RepID=A0A973WN31_9BRAD|nr:hypothetical protein [Bradyrhizobium quebecense]UGA46838.1 hypothetical protein HU230_0012645 [Bradyrhizobium quebecense]